MKPFEPIRSRHRIDGHPESSKIRPHSKSLVPSLTGAAVGGGAAAARAGNIGYRRGKRVPAALVGRAGEAGAQSPDSPGRLGAARPVLLPMGPARPASPPQEGPPPPHPYDDAEVDGEHPSVSPVTRGGPWSPGAAKSPQRSLAPRSPYANPNPGSQSPQLRAHRKLLLAEAAASQERQRGLGPSPNGSQPDPLGAPDGLERSVSVSGPRRGSVSLLQLSPVPPGPGPDQGARLRKLDLDRPVRERDVAARCETPRFHCPRNVDCMQGSGPHAVTGFCINPDDENDDLDQALTYHLRTQQEELFLEVPSVDHEGTLYFQPSAVRSGIATCAVMATDHAAIDSSEIKSSNWVGFTITIQPLPLAARHIKNRDWRSLQNKMTAPIAEVPPVRTDGPAAPQPGLFEPVDVHALRQPAEEKAAREKSLLFCRAAAPVRLLSFLQEADILRDGITSPEDAKQAEDRLRKDAETIIGPGVLRDLLGGKEDPSDPPPDPAVLPLVERLGKLCVAMGHSRAVDAEGCFRAVVRAHQRRLGIDGNSVEWGSPEWEDRLKDDSERHRESGVGAALLQSTTLLGVYLKHAGRLRDASDCFEEAIRLARVWNGDTDSNPFVLPLMLQLCEVQLTRGDAVQAYEVASIARAGADLGGKGESGSGGSDQVADIFQLYAQSCALRGDLTAAQAAMQRCLSVRKKLHGNVHLSVAEALMVQGRMMCAFGRLEQSVKLAQEAQEMAERKGKGQNANVVRTFTCHTLACHAQALTAKGKYSLALPLYERARELAAVSGSHSVAYARFAVELGAFHVSQKRPDAAVRCVDPVVEVLAQQVGDNHPDLALTEAVLGAALCRKEDHARAEQLLAHASQCFHAELSSMHDLQGLLAELRGDIAMETGQCDAALVLYREARSCVSEAGCEHQRSLRQPRLMERLCAAYCSVHQYVPDALISEYQAMLGAKQKEHGEWDFLVTPFLQNLAELHYLRGEYDEALQLFVRTLKISDNQNMVFLLGNLFKPAAQLDEAEIRERNRMAGERMSAQGALHFAVVLLQIAAVHEQQRACAEAEATYLQARAAFEIAGQPHHAGVCAALDGLGRVLFVSGMYGDALSYFHKSLEIRDDHFRDQKDFKEQIAAAEKNIFIVNKKLQQLHYVLQRHHIPGNPHTFPMYI
eukprot:TRINITY_DN23367_c0_g1_i1.p1 TRINITY_DN23367_c0_g1~~TRINITY_DN23367_c0_g1_i1.p1  ORF type:complete len:1156 (+),score=398.49 TRINITY_DN23367_c0_g1_i1:146-3613(+)